MSQENAIKSPEGEQEPREFILFETMSQTIDRQIDEDYMRAFESNLIEWSSKNDSF